MYRGTVTMVATKLLSIPKITVYKVYRMILKQQQ